MRIRVIAATQPQANWSRYGLKDYIGKIEGIENNKDEIEKLLNGDFDTNLERADRCITNGHHNTFGHTHVTLSFKETPKIITMLLSNIKSCNISEKSARFTYMLASKDEVELYNKWVNIFYQLARKKNPSISEAEHKNIAVRNAEYIISVFSPIFSFVFTIDIKDLNYFFFAAKNYIKKEKDTIWSVSVKRCLENFVFKTPKNLIIDGLENEISHLSLFAQRQRSEEFGENYSNNYLTSILQLSVAQHYNQSIAYEMFLPMDIKNRCSSAHIPFFIPTLIRHNSFRDKWLADIASISTKFPQGVIVHVNERGTLENFILKCRDCFCGNSQLEITEQTKSTFQKYLHHVRTSPSIYEQLKSFSYVSPL